LDRQVAQAARLRDQPSTPTIEHKNPSAQTGTLRHLARQRFAEMENALHEAKFGPTWLNNIEIATTIAESLNYREGKVYRLDAFSIMPNHLHMVFAPFPKPVLPGTCPTDHSLAAILHSLKSYTAQRANGLLNRTGAFWDHESYDHCVRDEQEWARTIAYVLNNPVKAGLVKDWNSWRWSYCRYMD